jgi:homoserine dehydrogenase
MNTVTTAQYYPVADDCLYKSVADIKTAAVKVLSADYLASVYTMLFEGTGDIEPRFADNKDGLLTVDICYNTYDFNTEIFPQTAVIKESGAGLIRAEVDCKTDGEPDKMNITLRQQDGVWLIDSPTY